MEYKDGTTLGGFGILSTPRDMAKFGQLVLDSGTWKGNQLVSKKWIEDHFDRIFLVTVLGEVENREQYLHDFYRMLKPDELLSVSEQAGDPDKLTIEETKTLAEESRFIYNELYGNKRNYTINFRK